MRATDAVGNTDPSSVIRTFTVDTTPPDTTIDSGPTGTTSDPTPTFEFSSEPGATFECRVDSDAFSSCSSPETLGTLPEGPHTFEVRATDGVGNTDPSPATRDFTVEQARIEEVTVGGPARVKRKRKVTYTVAISNSGNAAATGVRLKVSGRGLNSKASVGVIQGGSTRTVKVKLKPKKAGKVKASFKVISENAGGKTVRKKIRVKK